MHTHLDNIRLKQKSKIRELLNLGLIIILILFSVQISFAQNQANIWHFGEHVGLDFNSGEPVMIPFVNARYLNASATISDSVGNFLFSCNGKQIWNRSGDLMQNGESIIGSGASSQGALILQKPGSDHLYYVITLAHYPNPIGVHYSVVDMDLVGGLGAVTNEKDIPLEAAWDAMEKMTSARHSNGCDIWIIVRKVTEDAYASFLLTSSGITTEPILSLTRDINFNNMIGTMKISHDKKHLVAAYQGENSFNKLDQASEICNFNSETGEVEFLYTLTRNGNGNGKQFEPWAVEFSPDSKLLYLTYFNEITTVDTYELYQYDMQFYEDSLQFFQSEIKVAKGPLNGLQLARDGKIYCTGIDYGAYSYVSVIHEPWKRGTACNFEPDAIYMGPDKVYSFLPNILLDHLYRFEWDVHCSGQPITFQPNFIPEPVSIVWSFGDFSISHDLWPVHIYEHGGSYEVNVTVNYPSGRIEKTSRIIEIAESPHPDLGADTLVCEETPVTLSVAGEPGSYFWSNFSSGPTITVVDTGIYWVDVTNTEGCRTRDSIHVGWYNQAVLNETNLVITPTSCGSSDGSITGLTIEEVVPVSWGWHDGNGNLLGNNLDIVGLPVGNYFLQVTDDHGCVSISDSYTITDAGNILIDSVNFLPAHCQQNNGFIQVFVNTATGVDYFYSIDDGNLWQDQPLFENLAPSSYLVRVKDDGACETVFDNNPVVIQEIEGPQASAVSTPETDNLLNGSIQITAVVSSGDITYSIDNGTTLQVNDGLFTGLAAGFYTCLVQDGFGCDTTFIVEVEHRVSQTIEAIAGNGYTCIGNATTCPLLINNFMAVDSFHVTLFYDPALVECTGYFQIHPELEPGFQASLFPDLGEINLSWKGEQPLSLPDTTMVTLVFTAWSEGNPQLSWLNDQGQSRFFDVSGNEINAQLQPGNIRVFSRPVILLPAGTKSLCAGETLAISPIVFDEGAGDPKFHWIAPNGDTTFNELLWINNMTTQQAGKYSITITDTVDCQDTDTLLVIVGTGPSIAFSGYDTLFVEPGYILDAGNTAQSYWWNTGDTTAQIIIDSTGQYLVLATSFENCQSTDSVYILWAGKSFFIPNAFTPNGDGLNDVFGAIPRLDYVNRFHISIFNRWGQMIFDTSDLNQGWDGTFKGEACQAGAYVYRIVYRDFGMGTLATKVMEGTVMLVR